MNNKKKFLPSRHLSDAVLGAFRAKGVPFAKWCDMNGIRRENVRAALYGRWTGEKADAILEEIITAAGEETVSFLLEQRGKNNVQ